ncbi:MULTISPECIES: dihydrolipoamide acetyltransferase family protein [Kordiimonas]|jgi:pyruvate dehydrogenase E2 component (dihydrolipoamide acetyltransferase)|uniref:dihydrolipoamide acetyltransferase family protein n=1 Tax=Kordiimonas TaxID=288021 RepID=UPI00257C3D8A|nr:dihydrolipoamide acetyltransferase family protein [Kordiimonas sp. UBA4487]
MAYSFTLQDPGEGIHEVIIDEIMVSEGDHVNEGDPVMAVESDKAAIELPAPVSGTVKRLSVSKGDTVEVGAELMVFDDGSDDSDSGDDEDASSEPSDEEASDGKTEDDKSASAKSSDSEASDDEADEPEDAEDSSAKDTGGGNDDEEEGEKSARDTEGDDTASDDEEDTKDEREETKEFEGSEPDEGLADDRQDAGIKAAPAARAAADKHGIDLASVKPTGSKGHVTKQDVEKAAKSEGHDTDNAGDTGRGRETRKKMSGIRKATANHMARAWADIPHVTHQDRADITELEKARQQLMEDKDNDVDGLTLTAFVIKAMTIALKQHPEFNARLDMDNSELIISDDVNVAFALDTDRGLLTPVLRSVETKSIHGIATEMAAMAEKLHSGPPEKEDLEGGTITLTNVGSLGGTGFTPIINHPQVAILGMARAALEPVVMGTLDEPDIKARLMLPLVFAFDHRAQDGADAARFMTTLKGLLEDPNRLLVEAA